MTRQTPNVPLESYIYDLAHPRTQLILSLWEKGSSFTEIGKVLACTKQNAWRIVQALKEIHASCIKKHKLIACDALAHKIGITVAMLKRLCREGKIEHSKKNGAGYWFTTEQIKNAKTYIIEHYKTKCPYCGEVFFKGIERELLCGSSKCKRDHKQHKRNKLANQDNAELTGWHKDLWGKLQLHLIPENDIWISVTDAATHSGLNKIQIDYLRFKGILRVRHAPNPKYPMRRRSVYLFAVSELDIVKEVYHDSQLCS